METAGFTDGSDVDCERRRVQDDSKVCLAWATRKMEGPVAKMGKTAGAGIRGQLGLGMMNIQEGYKLSEKVLDMEF